jgi:hypothetical protein
VPFEASVQVTSIDAETDRGGRPCFRASLERCTNLSLGGAGLLTAEPLPPGRRVLLDFELPDGTSFETIGRVTWSRSVVGPGGRVAAGCGVEFLDPGRARRLQEWIASS